MVKAAFFITFIITLNCLGTVSLFSQNLVPNHSFEEYSACPSWVTQIYLAVPWVTPTNKTPDYFNVCATHPWVDVPLNAFGYQDAHTGVAYVGAQYHGEPYGNREYISVILDEPLLPETTYEVNFWVSLADETCGIKELGAYFSHEAPGPPELFGVLNVEPQIKADLGFVSDTMNWVLISGCFIPQGGEIWMTIGNFTKEHLTEVDTNCTIHPDSIYYNDSYYYMDDVSVIAGSPPDPYDLELGEPVFSCEPYLINPGIPNAVYYWEDGSTDTTLMVYESGIYTLTVTLGCTIGEDSIEIIIHDDESVELGPDEISICSGEAYTISLDPNWYSYEWQDGSTSAEYVISASGLYQVTMNDGCNETTDEILVNVINPPAPFSFGEDTYICPGDQLEFDFDFTIGDFLWQDGSTYSYISITESGSYSLTITNVCGSASDDIEVVQSFLPQFSLGPDSLYLCTGDSLNIYLDPDLGDYLWQDGSDQHVYNIIGPGLYALTVTNECGAVSDEIEIFYSDIPEINLGVDTFLCDNNALLLDVGDNDGSYLWQNQATDSILVINQTGIYSVTVTNHCGIDADTITINYLDSLHSLDLGPDLMLCPGDTITLHPNITSGNYSWQDQSTADSFLVSDAGIYWLHIANTCNAVSDTVQVIIDDNPPDIELPSTLHICTGSSIILDAGIPGVYLWNNGSTSPSLNVTSPGSYSVTVSNSCGTNADTTIVVDGGPAPLISLPAELFLCPGDTQLVTPAFSNVDSWLWQDGSTDTFIVVANEGLITLQVYNDCGIVYDTMQVSLLSVPPDLDLGNDTSICPGEIITLFIEAPGAEIAWSDGSSSPYFTIQDAGTYHAFVSNECGYSADSIHIDLLGLPPDLNLGMDQSLCPGETILINPQITDVNFLWHDGSNEPIFSSTTPGIIFLTISNSCGSDADTLLIYEDLDGPNLNLGEDIVGCEKDTVTLNAGISGVEYLWQDGSVNPEYVTNMTGTYILQVSNACGEDQDTINVSLSESEPSPALGRDTVLCENDTLLLQSFAGENVVVAWQDASSLPIYIVSEPGMYILSETNICGSASDTIIIDYISPPEIFSLGPDTTICPDEEFIMTAPQTDNLISWQDGSHENFFLADASGIYSLTISNNCGSVTDHLAVSEYNFHPVINLPSEIVVCEGEVVELDATQLFEAEYLWNTGDAGPTILISTPGIYALNITTNCSSLEQEILVIQMVSCHEIIYIPNSFSPNGDQVNDFWKVYSNESIDITTSRCSVFDRWGNQVFHSTSWPIAWDGYCRGDIMSSAVYVFMLHIEYLEGTRIIARDYNGDITLIR